MQVSMLTRRAKEYFEVLDELHSDGYVTHEEWSAMPVEIREKTAKMTNRIIEDALSEKGYSRGSANESLKYRRRWLEARGMLLGNTIKFDGQQATSTSDPILSAVEAFRKKLEKEAQEKADQAIQVAQEKVKEASANYEEIRRELTLTEKTLEALQTENKELKKENKAILHDLGKFEQNGQSLREQLGALEKNFQVYGENTEKHHQEMMQVKDQSIDTAREEIKKSHKNHKEEIDEYKTAMENNRHQWMMVLEETKTEKGKTERELGKNKVLLQKAEDVITDQEKKIKLSKQSEKQLHDEYKTNIHAISNKLKNAEQQVAVLENNVQHLKASLTEEKSDKMQAQQALLTARETIGQLKEQLQRREQQVCELEMMSTKKAQKNQKKLIQKIKKGDG